jgi:hypothetical protein
MTSKEGRKQKHGRPGVAPSELVTQTPDQQGSISHPPHLAVFTHSSSYFTTPGSYLTPSLLACHTYTSDGTGQLASKPAWHAHQVALLACSCSILCSMMKLQNHRRSKSPSSSSLCIGSISNKSHHLKAAACKQQWQQQQQSRCLWAVSPWQIWRLTAFQNANT